jgi:hypothetical protein
MSKKNTEILYNYYQDRNWNYVRLIPFVFGLIEICIIAPKHSECVRAASAFLIAFPIWIFNLTFVHFDWRIQTYSQIIVETTQTAVALGLILWGSIELGKSEDCSTLTRNAHIAFAIIGAIVFIMWVVTFLLRLMYRNIRDKTFSFSILISRGNITRLFLFIIVIVLFGIIVSTTDTTMNDYWMVGVVLSVTVLQISCSMFFHSLDTWIEPVLEGGFLLSILIWWIIGWVSFNSEYKGNTANSILTVLILTTIILTGWMIVYLVRLWRYFYSRTLKSTLEAQIDNTNFIPEGLFTGFLPLVGHKDKTYKRGRGPTLYDSPPQPTIQSSTLEEDLPTNVGSDDTSNDERLTID